MNNIIKKTLEELNEVCSINEKQIKNIS